MEGLSFVLPTFSQLFSLEAEVHILSDFSTNDFCELILRFWVEWRLSPRWHRIPFAIMVLVKIIINVIGGNIRYELSRVSYFFGSEFDESDFLELSFKHLAEFEKPEVMVGNFSFDF